MDGAGVTPAGPVWGAVLAAGRSSRLGTPKALARVDGEPLAARALRSVLAAPAIARALLVLGHGARAVAAEVRRHVPPDPRWAAVVNRRHREGLGTSVALAARVAREGGAAALVLVPCDLPLLDAEAVHRVVAAWWQAAAEGREAWAVRSVAAGRPTHPVLLAGPLLARAGDLTGDRGAGPLLEGLGPRCLLVEQPPELALDLDTPEDARVLAERHGLAITLPAARRGRRPG